MLLASLAGPSAEGTPAKAPEHIPPSSSPLAEEDEGPNGPVGLRSRSAYALPTSRVFNRCYLTVIVPTIDLWIAQK